MATRIRLSVDERREQLIALGERLFSERPFEDVSIDDIAASAGISKGLLYHYFGSKRDFYVEVVRHGVATLRAVTAVPAGVPEPERTLRSLDAYFRHVEAHAEGFRHVIGAGGGVDPEIAAILGSLREEFVARVLEGLRRGGTVPAAPPPLLRTAIRGWVGMVEGASLDWLAHGDSTREELCRLLLAALAGTVEAALGAQALTADG